MEGMDVDLDAELMQKFSCLGTTDKDVLIGEFQRLLGFQLSPAGCAFFLDMTNWCGPGAGGGRAGRPEGARGAEEPRAWLPSPARSPRGGGPRQGGGERAVFCWALCPLPRLGGRSGAGGSSHGGEGAGRGRDGRD